MIIGVDIDGTLTVEKDGHEYESRTPNRPIIKKINKLYEQGHMIILFSSRWEADRKVTKDWLKKYGVKYHGLILGKPLFDLYIDDRAIRLEELSDEKMVCARRFIKSQQGKGVERSSKTPKKDAHCGKNP